MTQDACLLKGAALDRLLGKIKVGSTTFPCLLVALP